MSSTINSKQILNNKDIMSNGSTFYKSSPAVINEGWKNVIHPLANELSNTLVQSPATSDRAIVTSIGRASSFWNKNQYRKDLGN